MSTRTTMGARARIWGLGAVPLAVGLGCAEPEIALEPAPPGPGPVLRTAGWEGFPIVMEGITASQITNYTYDLDGELLGLEDLIDVAAYYTSFQPCDLGPQPDADLASFGYDRAVDYIDAAAAKRLHVLVPLPYLGNVNAVPVDAYACDGVVILDEEDEPIEMWNHDQTVQIPLGKDQLTAAYTSYWSAKVGPFIEAVDAYDTGDVVWSWRGLEELRYWRDGDVGLGRAMRDEVNDHDGTRFLSAYTPNHYMPGPSMLGTLVDPPRPALSPYDPMSVLLDPADPAARDAVAGVVTDFYPRPVAVNLEVTGGLRPMFDHIMTGSYTGLILGADGHENRIQPLHRARLGLETRANLETVYAANGQTPPHPIVFHVPDLSLGGVPHMSLEEARHDFWAGLHTGEGLYLYSFAYRDANPDVWDAYVRGLHLIVSEMRPLLAEGNRWTPTTWSDGAVQTVPGDHYLGLSPSYAGADHLALPKAADPEYPTLNATIVAMAGSAYLIVTHSWAQPVSFEVTMPACTLGAEVAYGESDDLAVAGGVLEDSFAGIDGRVYRIFVAPC